MLLPTRTPSTHDGEEALWTLLGSVPLVKFGPKPNPRPLRMLLTAPPGVNDGDHKVGEDQERGSGGDSDSLASSKSGAAVKTSSASARRTGHYISFWKPEVSPIFIVHFTVVVVVRLPVDEQYQYGPVFRCFTWRSRKKYGNSVSFFSPVFQHFRLSYQAKSNCEYSEFTFRTNAGTDAQPSLLRRWLFG